MLILPDQWLPRESSAQKYNDFQAKWKDDASFFLTSRSSSFLTSAQVSSLFSWLETGECWRESFLSVNHKFLSFLFQDWMWRSSLWTRIPGVPLGVQSFYKMAHSKSKESQGCMDGSGSVFHGDQHHGTTLCFKELSAYTLSDINCQ